MLKHVSCILQFTLFIYLNSIGQKISLGKPLILVPSGKIPSKIKIQKSNNNVDVILFKETYYMAFRTGAHHFPNKKSKLYILRSKDLNKWEYETEISLGNDVREPRWIEFNNRLFLYYFEGGRCPLQFQPQHIWVSYPLDSGLWYSQIIQGMDGFVPWRLKSYDNYILMSAYWGKDLYGNHKGELRLFKSFDGLSWRPISEKPQVSANGAEEGEFEFDNEGNLWACVRLEGEGSLICYAPKNSLHQWTSFKSKRKYDSSCMFNHNNNIYLVARRNLDGEFSKAPAWFPYSLKKFYNLIRYSLTAKTTALYKLNKTLKEFEWLIDLPGCGDNAFPKILSKSPNKFLLFNYSNDFNKPLIPWLVGQLKKTFIYFMEIDIQ